MQNVKAGTEESEVQPTGVLGKTMNTLGETANWMLGRDQ